MHEITRLTPLRWKWRGAAGMALAASLSSPALAQQAPSTIRLLPEDAARGLSGPQHNFDFLPPGVSGDNGDNYKTAGFFGQKLRPYLAGHPEALAHLDDYRRQKTIFLIDRIVAVSAFGFYGQQILAHGERQYFNDNQKVAIGVFATSVLATIFINRNTNAHLQRAVNSYNAGLSHGGFWPRMQPTAIGFAAAATGQPLLALRWALR